MVNPDDDSVTFFDVRHDRNARLGNIVGKEPNSVAVLPDGRQAYLANTVSGTVSVVRRRGNGRSSRAGDDDDDGSDKDLPFRVVKEIKVGTEPYGVALTPNGKKLYGTNALSNSVSVIDTATDTVVETIANVGIEPRGIAITNDGDGDDLDETVYVTQFLALPIPGKVDGEDDAKAGKVTVIASATDTVFGEVTLNPIADAGFKALGDSIQRRS